MTDFENFEQDLDTHFKQDRPGNPTRPLLTFLRSRYHFYTHAIAISDRKANIMVRLNSLIISGLIVLFKLYGSFTTTEVIVLSSLLIATLLSLTFATFAAQPLAKNKIRNTDHEDELAYHLFDFKKNESPGFDEFRKGFEQVMNDNQLIFGNMARDLYQLSGATAYKYRQLRIAYKTFRLSLILVAILFVVILFEHGYL